MCFDIDVMFLSILHLHAQITTFLTETNIIYLYSLFIHFAFLISERILRQWSFMHKSTENKREFNYEKNLFVDACALGPNMSKNGQNPSVPYLCLTLCILPDKRKINEPWLSCETRDVHQFFWLWNFIKFAGPISGLGEPTPLTSLSSASAVCRCVKATDSNG